MSQADEHHRDEMRDRLRRAADHFSATLTGTPVWGWRDRTIGSRVTRADGERWLRVSWALTHWAEGSYWTGNHDASLINDVPKPQVIDLYEWDEPHARCRAELMTLILAAPCSATPELRDDVALPDRWWLDLRSALDVLGSHTTDRTALTPRQAHRRALAFFGSAAGAQIVRWSTVHGDLNWSNLTAPELVLLDWESFGTGPACYDAATLYCLALLAPATAKRVHDTFSDVLDTPDGLRTQLQVVIRYLKRVEQGEFADLADPLHLHARQILERLSLG
jgi:hypothetical protein